MTVHIELKHATLLLDSMARIIWEWEDGDLFTNKNFVSKKLRSRYLVLETKGLHPCLQDLVNTRIREPDSQKMAGSCLVREKIRFSGLVCSRLAFLI